MSKNIVICCDGTCNQVAGSPTNVLRIFHTLIRDDRQLAFYDGGVGTLNDPTALWPWQKYIRRKLDAAIGNSIRSNFCRAYEFLSTHYEPGDKLYLFGFSRGAYTIRALAGAIFRFGILRTELNAIAEYAWSSYADELQDLSEHQRFEAAARFKKYFAVEPKTPVWFVGAFDTVSSLGWIWDYRTLPNTAINPLVCNVRHALAIDERRALFGVNRLAAATPDSRLDQKEVWFAGVHSDVGGGYPDDEAGLAKLSLEWMLREANEKGLLVDSDRRDEFLGIGGHYTSPDPTGKLHNSLDSAFWYMLEFLPRRAWSGALDRMAWRAPNLFRRRRYGTNPCIHSSVIVRRDRLSEYRPSILTGNHTIEK